MTGQSRNQGVRLGIVGTGVMASQMAHAAKFVEGVSISAVLSRNASRASTFCQTHASEAVVCDDNSQLFNTVDAVYVATPPQSHAAFIELAVSARKPVLCEKPLTIASTDTTRLLKLARDAGVPLVEAIWTLALPAYREMKKAFDDRRNAVLHFDFSYPADLSGQTHLSDPNVGGVLIDRSVYGYAAGISLLGNVIEQTAWVTRDSTGLAIDAELRLEHAEGARSLITLSIDKVGPNLIHVSNGSGLMVLGPTSLASETLRKVAGQDITQSPVLGGPAALKSRLKVSSTLRALKARFSSNGQFLSYGGSSYAPILRDFISVIEQGRIASDTVPHKLSEQIAFLTEDARSQSMRKNT